MTTLMQSGLFRNSLPNPSLEFVYEAWAKVSVVGVAGDGSDVLVDVGAFLFGLRSREYWLARRVSGTFAVWRPVCRVC